MEAHTPVVTFPSEWAKRPRRPRLHLFRELVRTRRERAALRAYSARSNRSVPVSIPGSEHTHLLRRPRGF
jgi:DNA primase